jgi:hypothetical protein
VEYLKSYILTGVLQKSLEKVFSLFFSGQNIYQPDRLFDQTGAKN